jgi:peroxiredoxin
LADPALKLTNALDLAFDGTAIFGGPRSKRYALIVDDGKVLKTFIEPDNTGIKGNAFEILNDFYLPIADLMTVSAAENVLRGW